MRAIAIGLISLAFIAPAAAAAPAGSSCAAPLRVLQDQWQAVGYPVPTKPAQAQVMARNGQVATGAQVTYMRTQLLVATQECSNGNDQAALQRIAEVQGWLGTPASATYAREHQ